MGEGRQYPCHKFALSTLGENTSPATLYPKMAAVDAFVLFFKTYTDTLCRLRRKIINDNNDEDLHQFRIRLRKILSLLGYADIVLDRKICLKFKQELKEIISITNTKRDLDVLRDQIAQIHQDRLSSTEQNALRSLEIFLKKEIAAEHDKILLFLQSETFNLRIRHWRDFLEGEYRFFLSGCYDRAIYPLGAYLILQAFKKIEKRAKKIQKERNSNPETLHKLRIDFKRLRYLLEAFAPLFPPKFITKERKRLKKIQNLLGSYHDAHQQKILLERYAKLWRARGLKTEIIERVLLPTIKTFQQKEIAAIEKELLRFLKKRKRYRKAFYSTI